MNLRSRRRWAIAGSSALVLAAVAGVSFWALENPPMDAIELTAPTSTQLEAVAQARVYFGHQSVGANILSEWDHFFEAAGMASPSVVTVNSAPQAGGFLAHSLVGTNGDPAAKIADFARVVDGPLGARIDVALLKFCYIDITAQTDVRSLFDTYSRAIEALQGRHPDIRFLVATVPLTTDRGWRSNIKAFLGQGQSDHAGPVDNIAREQFNQLVRERYGESAQLFDIAAVEATLRQKPTTRTEGGLDYFVLNRALAADAAHLNQLGSRLAVAELIRVVATNTP